MMQTQLKEWKGVGVCVRVSSHSSYQSHEKQKLIRNGELSAFISIYFLYTKRHVGLDFVGVFEKHIIGALDIYWQVNRA